MQMKLYDICGCKVLASIRQLAPSNMDEMGAAQFLARSVYRSFSTVSQSSRDSQRISWDLEGSKMPEPRMPSMLPPGDDKSMR